MEGSGERALAAARDSGLIPGEGDPLLVMLSGGADSVCLLHLAVRLGARPEALHLNYGLREGSDDDEALCRAACDGLDVRLHVERVRLRSAAADAAGNLQAEAREARYAAAERLAGERDCDYATAHTATDQAETVLYRLATSPGRRALLGMPARRGRLVRPLLDATRADARAYCEERGLAFRDDPSNLDPRFARARIRHEVLPVLRDLADGEAERTIAETALLLRDEDEVLRTAVDEALERLGGAAAPLPLADLREMPAGLVRLVLRRAAEEAAGEPHSLSRGEADRVLALGERRRGTATLDLGAGLRAVAEYGMLRFTREADAAPPEPVRLTVPGEARFGAWHVEARALRGGGDGGAVPPGEAIVSAEPLGEAVTVRAWRPGDRMRPAGLGGTKTLQDLFTDRKVPRGLRHALPVVEAEGGEIVWVAGVAVAERFRAAPGAGARADQARERLVVLSARRAARGGA